MSACKGCGKRVIWAVMNTDEGDKKIPLDPFPPIYLLVGIEGGDPIVRREVSAMVNHFSVCPKANDFSSSRKKVAT